MNTKSVSLESAEKGITASFSLRELSDGESEQVRGGSISDVEKSQKNNKDNNNKPDQGG
jgi:hypothetical protein